jgi:hypothetical protein
MLISVILYFYLSSSGSKQKKQTLLYVAVFGPVGCEGPAYNVVQYRTIGVHIPVILYTGTCFLWTVHAVGLVTERQLKYSPNKDILLLKEEKSSK